ncbi:hypothetical protein [Rhodoferax lacus]|uniref:hypothetical protein n=1 Tax=Rhodoferax lacus TaxID=2184758 RepID=UPI0011C156F0|nr:hypothetical protein [Rhodoferax lacus]
MNPSKRYLAAIAANLDQLQRAQMAWICTQGFAAAGQPTHLFAKLCFNALFNDYISKCAKVFELGRQTASIWYIERTNSAAFLAAMDNNKGLLDQLCAIAVPLKHLRDRDLMHLDETGVLDPNGVWEAAALNPRELQVAVKATLRVLRNLASQNNIDVPPLPRSLNGPRTSHIAKYLYNYVQ